MMFGQWHGSTAFGKWFGGLQADVVPFVEEQFHVFTEVFASWVETSNAVFVVDTALAASSLFAPAVPVVAVMSAASEMCFAEATYASVLHDVGAQKAVVSTVKTAATNSGTQSGTVVSTVPTVLTQH
jgi:hypothetical protein